MLSASFTMPLFKKKKGENVEYKHFIKFCGYHATRSSPPPPSPPRGSRRDDSSSSGDPRRGARGRIHHAQSTLTRELNDIVPHEMEYSRFYSEADMRAKQARRGMERVAQPIATVHRRTQSGDGWWWWSRDLFRQRETPTRV